MDFLYYSTWLFAEQLRLFNKLALEGCRWWNWSPCGRRAVRPAGPHVRVRSSSQLLREAPRGRGADRSPRLLPRPSRGGPAMLGGTGGPDCRGEDHSGPGLDPGRHPLGCPPQVA